MQKVFPVFCSTCISTQKIGEPKQYFDMTIMDEASQCNTAVSLVPIIRGKSLMLVGDPQQLNPVITLDPNINNELKAKYNVNDSYDYIKKAPALQTFEYLYDFAKCVIEREGEMVGSQFFLQIYMDLLERGEIPAWSVWISCGN